ncbi:MAG: hypothetical protein Q4C95_08625, partial [Planctomycetia bacterium]|nr:hypothetical protein [Planctomycetia bacterium]
RDFKRRDSDQRDFKRRDSDRDNRSFGAKYRDEKTPNRQGFGRQGRHQNDSGGGYRRSARIFGQKKRPNDFEED